ncbi:uncharacterized protein DUF488 [Halopolyspora algeriensis]|uniref:Uncharacterized protein DUF488 n=1 Tax=Halopolyspora algeriensis TaxID=1500506 RepID=A0A368VRR4_9ACTN|nr:DUF488 domain-containing protein [Halopolyspora algeriensis]RCW44590.1 uncharacterized protein DUF488 [Halopolyspora algeriensis]TQM55951.1 uncharacterized protein DUF488 [Halopolyspora algeriensis]
MRVVTVGHGTASLEGLTELLGHAGVVTVVDVRSAPGSRRHPWFARSELERSLPARGFGYRWDERLGGFRKPAEDSPDRAWKHRAFRGYAGHMRTGEFREAVRELLAEVGEHPSAVMCSESVWWRCHRRLIADYVRLVHGIEVAHLMHDGRLSEHRAIDGVRVRDDGLLVYDAGQQSFGA